MTTSQDFLPQLIREHQHEILEEWMRLQRESSHGARSLISEGELLEQSRHLISSVNDALAAGAPTDNLSSIEWEPAREYLARISRTRAEQGITAVETAAYVYSLKQALQKFIEQDAGSNTALFAAESWRATLLLDRLGLWTMEVHQKSREGIIQRQQQELLELSTPVVRLWDGVLALPLIGTLDSARTQVVMESLLEEIVNSGAQIAIIDITGVPTVDTLVAQHLLKTVAAARLMGADCIISGIRPQIAQTIVHLGVELNDVATKSTLADAFALALQRAGLTVVSKR